MLEQEKLVECDGVVVVDLSFYKTEVRRDDEVFIEPDGLAYMLKSGEDENLKLLGCISEELDVIEYYDNFLVEAKEQGVFGREDRETLFLSLEDLADANIDFGVIEFVDLPTSRAIVSVGLVYATEEDLVTCEEYRNEECSEYLCLENEIISTSFLEGSICSGIITDAGAYHDSISLEEVMESVTTLLGKIDGNLLPKEPTCAPECREREEKSNMDNLFGGLGFGKLKGNRFKLSMNGVAVLQPSTGKYVVYNKDNNEIVDVTNLIFDIKDGMFILPAVDLGVGDTVVHEDKPYYIIGVGEEIKAISYEDCTQTILIPKSTMFGIKYFTKVFSMFGDNFATSGDLFSNPMMLMTMLDGNMDMSKMMLMNSMSSGDFTSNPLLLSMLLKGDGKDDSLSTIAMMSMFNNGTNPFAPATKKETKKETKEKADRN